MEQPGNDLFSKADDSTAKTRAEYSEIRAELSTRILGREDLVSRLALVTYLHRRGAAVQRLLFVGPSGAGKTHVARAIAEVSGAPFLSVDAQQITEAGWSGLHLDEFLAGFAAQVKNSALLARSVVLVDEVDKLKVSPEMHGNAPSKAKGQQSLLLGLFGVGAPFATGPGQAIFSLLSNFS